MRLAKIKDSAVANPNYGIITLGLFGGQVAAMGFQWPRVYRDPDDNRPYRFAGQTICPRECVGAADYQRICLMTDCGNKVEGDDAYCSDHSATKGR